MTEPDAGAAPPTTLLMCGIASAVLYPAADIVAGLSYPGYSFRSQAVSELFAIGAPTARLVVTLFTLSSALVAAFAYGVRLSAGRSRALGILSVMLLCSAIDSLVLWNFFPMHMRGVPPTFTDGMHGLLAINPFVVLSVCCAIAAFRDWFRFYSIATVVVLAVTAAFGFAYIRQIIANEPTPWLGLAERAGQYAYDAWLATLAIVLLRVSPSGRAARPLRESPQH